jgi:hypothetical protein
MENTIKSMMLVKFYSAIRNKYKWEIVECINYITTNKKRLTKTEIERIINVLNECEMLYEDFDKLELVKFKKEIENLNIE